ncbi:MAG: PQQ-binding-like beta-propeller repeat protein [Planctomycetaceae bacterium]|nr:PQQ-binding-like beta-propeller repeat protein [Planctomycetaceae bacterium]
MVFRSRVGVVTLLSAFFLSPTIAVVAADAPAPNFELAPDDWPWWRGPTRDGVAAAHQKPPLVWSETQNVVWKSPVPGRGHSSPTVVGDRVYLTTADVERGTQSVLCFDRTNGRSLWTTIVHTGGLPEKGHQKNSQASSSVACDGRRLYVNFLNGDAVYTTALDLDGRRLWQTKVDDFVIHQGFGSSPALYKSLVIVSADNKGGGAVAALDRVDGRVVWRIERPALPNYTSPIILNVAGKDQLLLTGCDLVTSLDPLTGQKLWEIPGSTTEVVTSTVTDGRRVFSSGGYPKNHLAAIAADGSGKIEWESDSRVYVPSLLTRDGYLYGVLDNGVAVCWESSTGKEIWKERLGGTFSSSPVMVGDLIFAIDETGKAAIFRASPTEFEAMGSNQLGDEAFASPTVCGDRIYLRVATTTDGVRQETLYCLGKR